MRWPRCRFCAHYRQAPVATKMVGEYGRATNYTKIEWVAMCEQCASAWKTYGYSVKPICVKIPKKKAANAQVD